MSSFPNQPILTPNKLAVARRTFLNTALAGAGALALSRSVFGAKVKPAAAASDIPDTEGVRSGFSDKRDQDILNFALNLEYLEAEFYLFAATGQGLTDADSDGVLGPVGQTTGGAQVNFDTPQIEDLANELAEDELAHVKFLRFATTKSVSRPAIDLTNSFTAAAQAAGLVGRNETFNAFANENNFLLAAFIFEDVGVTAYRGAAPLLNNRTILGYAASILAVEAYHAGAIRTLLGTRSDLIANAGSVEPQVTIGEATNAISNLRDTADGGTDSDQGILNTDGSLNIVPADANGLAFARTPGQVVSIAYLAKDAEKGGFLPSGVNGRIEGVGSK